MVEVWTQQNYKAVNTKVDLNTILFNKHCEFYQFATGFNPTGDFSRKDLQKDVLMYVEMHQGIKAINNE